MVSNLTKHLSSISFEGGAWVVVNLGSLSREILESHTIIEWLSRRNVKDEWLPPDLTRPDLTRPDLTPTRNFTLNSLLK